MGNSRSPDADDCDDDVDGSLFRVPDVEDWSLSDSGNPDAAGRSSCKGGAPDGGGDSVVPDPGGLSSGAVGGPGVAGSSLCKCRVPDSGSGLSCGCIPDIDCPSFCDGAVPNAGDRSLPICGPDGGKRPDGSSTGSPRFSKTGVTSLTMSRDLWRTIAGAATATWTTERIRRIRAAILSQRIFVKLCNVDCMVLKVEQFMRAAGRQSKTKNVSQTKWAKI